MTPWQQTARCTDKTGKEMMNDEQGISNVEVVVRVFFLHHSTFLI
jgi:hypothetical protein